MGADGAGDQLPEGVERIREVEKAQKKAGREARAEKERSGVRNILLQCLLHNGVEGGIGEMAQRTAS